MTGVQTCALPIWNATWGCALVTGAGSGIGRAVAMRLATSGANVAALDLRFEGGARNALEAAAAHGGGRAVASEVDVTDAPTVRGAGARAVDEIARASCWARW